MQTGWMHRLIWCVHWSGLLFIEYVWCDGEGSSESIRCCVIEQFRPLLHKTHAWLLKTYCLHLLLSDDLFTQHRQARAYCTQCVVHSFCRSKKQFKQAFCAMHSAADDRVTYALWFKVQGSKQRHYGLPLHCTLGDVKRRIWCIGRREV